MKKIILIAFLVLGLKSYSCNIYDTINQTICPEDSFLFNGIYLKTAGTYYDTFNISVGCDTFRTLILSVHLTIPNTFVVDSFCQGYGMPIMLRFSPPLVFIGIHSILVMAVIV